MSFEFFLIYYKTEVLNAYFKKNLCVLTLLARGGGADYRPPLGFFNLLATIIELDVSNSVTFPSTTKYMLC